MEVVKLVKRDMDDPLACAIYESHKLVSTTIDDSDPLCERFNDTRTPYEQYCAGERYLKYDDEKLYSRAAHEWMHTKSRYPMFPRKNFEVRLDNVL